MYTKYIRTLGKVRFYARIVSPGDESLNSTHLNAAVIVKVLFPNTCYGLDSRAILVTFFPGERLWEQVNIDWGNGLLSWGMPLPETVLTQIYIAIIDMA